jgi:hypothetical protein
VATVVPRRRGAPNRRSGSCRGRSPAPLRPVRGPTASATPRSRIRRSSASSSAPERSRSRRSASSGRSRAKPQLAVGRQADPVAGGAEGRGHRRDESNRASRARDPPETGRIGGVALDRIERVRTAPPAGPGSARLSPIPWSWTSPTPSIGMISRKRTCHGRSTVSCARSPTSWSFWSRTTTELSLIGPQPPPRRRPRCRPDEVEPAASGHELELDGIEGVDADVDAVQPRRFQRFGDAAEEQGIGGHRELVDARNRLHRADQLDEPRDALSARPRSGAAWVTPRRANNRTSRKSSSS